MGKTANRVSIKKQGGTERQGFQEILKRWEERAQEFFSKDKCHLGPQIEHTGNIMGGNGESIAAHSGNTPISETGASHKRRTRNRTSNLGESVIRRPLHRPGNKEHVQQNSTRVWWNTRRSIQRKKTMCEKTHNKDHEPNQGWTTDTARIDKWTNSIHIKTKGMQGNVATKARYA